MVQYVCFFKGDNMKLKDYFFDNFMGIDESTVLTAVEELTDTQKKLVYYTWGVDSKHRNPNSKEII